MCAGSPGTEVVRWSRKFQTFRGGTGLRSSPKLFFRVSGSRSVAERGIPARPCLSRGLLWAGRPRRAPDPAHGVAEPALLAGRWHPPSAQSSARSAAARSGSGREVGDRAQPAAPPLAGSDPGNAGCAVAGLLPPFLSCLLHLPGLGRERPEGAPRHVAISRD